MWVWNASFRLYSTTILITTLVMGPILICGYFPNTAEHVILSFLKKSLNPIMFETIGNVSGNSSKNSSPMLNYIWGFFAAEMWLGSICGVLFCLMVGRKLSTMCYLRLVPLVCIPSYILQFFAKPTDCWECLLIGRFLSEIGYGVCHVVIPIFLCEIAGPHHRGIAIMTSQILKLLMGNMGSLMGSKLAFGTDEKWNWVFVLLAFMSFLGLVHIMLIPESPEYLEALGDKERVKQSLKFYQDNTEASEAVVNINLPNEKPLDLKLSLKQLGPIVLVSAMLTTVTQRSMARELFLYSTAVFELFGLPSVTCQALSVVSKFLVLGATTFSLHLISAISRKQFFIFTSASSAMGFSLLASYPLWPIIAGLEWLFVITTSCCMLTGFAVLSLYYIIIPEIFPFEYRVMAKSLAMLTLDSVTALSAFTLFPALEYFGPSTFLLNAIPLLICVGVLVVMMPDTKDKGPEDILRDFGIEVTKEKSDD